MEEKFIGEKNVDLVFGDHKVPCIFKKYVKPEKGDTGSFDQLFHSSEMKRPFHRQVILTYWNYELFDAVLDLADYFSEVFATPITELITSRTMSVWKFRRAIQWLISRQSSIKRIDYLHNELSDADISMFFGNCNVTERLTICMKDNDRIRHHRYFDLDTLKISMASWVTIDYLLDMDCIFFRISGANMTSFDCNRFIKSWLNGTNHRLEIISMNCGQILERDDVLDGLETRHRSGYLVERFKNHKVGGSTFEFCIRGGFDVQREDGKLATVDTSMMDRGLFLFVVWTEDDISEGFKRQESEGTDGDVGCTLL
ncbi:hypothetical protein CRE_29441 [Caenorhabditis remanei]|uniref:Sdz-33 F-box domain-containing protein n=1 Tax=Caenorhabditis remanei TaxID=31234 RepID=E3LV10_CAERE|nr:hypothetical protein CRE_29441 [Caenorhabditis remanei]